MMAKAKSKVASVFLSFLLRVGLLRHYPGLHRSAYFLCTGMLKISPFGSYNDRPQTTVFESGYMLKSNVLIVNNFKNKQFQGASMPSPTDPVEVMFKPSFLAISVQVDTGVLRLKSVRILRPFSSDFEK